MNATLRRFFTEYADAHQHPTNRLTHKIAIPLIVFHIIAMLDWVTLARLPVGGGDGFRLTLGIVIYVAAIAWYMSLSPKLAVIMALLYALCFPIGRMTPMWLVVVIAAVGWLIQLAGHLVWEKKQPAFFTNLLQALIGPLFFVAVLTGDWPERQVSSAR